jgi:hypothetical protein
MTLAKKLSDIARTAAVVVGLGILVGVTVISACGTVNNWKLRNYYNRALTFYGDTSGNGKIETEEEEKFLNDFSQEVRKKPGYEDFNLRKDDIPKYNSNAKKVLSLLKEYRPVPPF